MRAVVITKPGPPDVLEVQDRERPIAGVEQILVRVHGAGLNRADLLQREGRYPPPPGASLDIPGLEFAGVVEECGAGSLLFSPGDRVFGITSGGAHAEYVAVHERAVARVPASLDLIDAGGVPEVFITAHDALFVQAGVRPSDRVLVHAVGSGVGLAAVQLCRQIGAVPYGTARTADKIERARKLGLENGIAIAEDPRELVEPSRDWTEGRGFDVVLDLVGGAYVGASVDALGSRGRLVLIGTVAGARAELELGKVLHKRLHVIGTVLRARPIEEKIAATAAFAREVVPMLARGAVRPIVDRTFSIDEVRAAHEHLASNDTFGKVVLRITE